LKRAGCGEYAVPPAKAKFFSTNLVLRAAFAPALWLRKNHFRCAARTDLNQQGSVWMLNEVDGQAGGNASDNAREAVDDAEALFRNLKNWVKADYNSRGQVNWRREAREDFDFEAGDQLNEEDKVILT
jgi:hypothetical protein